MVKKNQKPFEKNANFRLLLLESNEEHAKLLKDGIKKELPQSQIRLATSAHDGVEQIVGKAFDCILTDYSLPDMKGPRLIHRLKKYARSTPIIVVTGRGDERTATEVLKSGASDYIVKNKQTLKQLPEIIYKTIVKERWEKNPLFIPAALAGKLLTEIDELTEKVKDITDSGFQVIETHQIKPLKKKIDRLKKFAQSFMEKKHPTS